MSGIYPVGLIGYFALMLLVGFWAARRVSSEADFLVAGRGIGLLVMIGTVCGTFWGAGIFIAGPGFAYGMGYGLLLSIVGSLTSVVLLSFFVAGRLRRFKGITIPDLMADRFYSGAMRILTALVVAEVGIVLLAVEIYGGALLLSSIFGWSNFTSLLVISVVYVLYTVFGGMLAVAVTDLIQSLIMLAGTIVVIPFVLRATGGLSAMHATLAHISPTHLDPLAGGFITPSLIVSWVIVFGIGNLTPSLLTRFFAAKNERTAIRSAAIGAAVGWLFMYVAIFLGVAAKALFPNLPKADLAFPTLITGVLPPVVGVLVLSAGMAALMSTADSVLFTVASALSHDIYAAFIRRTASDRARLTAARVATLLVGVLALVLASTVVDVVYWLQMFSSALAASAFAPVLLAGLLWRRATREGAIAAMIGGSVGAIVWQALGVPVQAIHPVYAGITVSLILLVVVSLLTPPPPEKVLAKYFAPAGKPASTPVAAD